VPVTRTVGGSWTDIRDCPILRKPTGGVSRGNLLRRPVGTRSSHRPSSGVPSTSDRELARRSRSRWGRTGPASALHHRARQRARRLPCARRSSARRCQAGRGVGHTDRFLVTTPVDIEIAAEHNRRQPPHHRPQLLTGRCALCAFRPGSHCSCARVAGVYSVREAPSRPGSVVPQVWDSEAWPQSTTRPHRPNFLQRTALAHAHL
jgi:hypothetical protein